MKHTEKGSASGGAVLEVVPGSQLFTGVLNLAKKFSATLGFLPDTAFADRAAAGRLLAVEGESSDVAGYILFDVTRGRVRIIQCCTSPAYRGSGLARVLIGEVSRRHQELHGLILKCRRDFAASDVWPKLGFIPLTDVPGRGIDGKLLTVWWLDHGHANLFTEIIADAPQMIAVLDLNVFLDLHDRKRDGFIESRALLADWLPTHLKLAVTAQLQIELNALEDTQERAAQRLAISAYELLTPLHTVVDHLYNQLIAALDDEVLSEDQSLVTDCRHLASAAASGAAIFVTRDGNALEVLRMVALDILGLHMIRPSEVLVHLDEISNSLAYRPADLLQTGYALQEVGAGSEDQVVAAFLNSASGERRVVLQRTWRAVVASGDVWRRQAIMDPSGDLVGLFVSRLKGDDYEIRLLRTAGPLADTLASQILALIRRQARSIGAIAIRLDDPFPSKGVRHAATLDGFVDENGIMVGATADLCGTATEVLTWVNKAVPLCLARQFNNLDLQIEDAATAAELEHRLWPLKIVDASIPTYIVPIDPAWSYELFGFPQGLLRRDDRLGLSREHVYYRSTRPQPFLPGPGRLLWYASGRGHSRVGAVFACSRLLDVQAAAPEVLYRRFKHLGVWQLEHIRKAARAGNASAVRFADTELFQRTISYRRMKELTEDCRVGTLQSPARISPEAFGRIYREGVAHDNA